MRALQTATDAIKPGEWYRHRFPPLGYLISVDFILEANLIFEGSRLFREIIEADEPRDLTPHDIVQLVEVRTNGEFNLFRATGYTLSMLNKMTGTGGLSETP